MYQQSFNQLNADMHTFTLNPTTRWHWSSNLECVQHEAGKHNHLPSIYIYMSNSTGVPSLRVKLLEREKAFPTHRAGTPVCPIYHIHFTTSPLCSKVLPQLHPSLHRIHYVTGACVWITLVNSTNVTKDTYFHFRCWNGVKMQNHHTNVFLFTLRKVSQWQLEDICVSLMSASHSFSW